MAFKHAPFVKTIWDRSISTVETRDNPTGLAVYESPHDFCTAFALYYYDYDAYETMRHTRSAFEVFF